MSHKKTVFTSYGVLCFRRDSDDLKALLIQKQTSYEFTEFISGKYDPKDLKGFAKMVNGMTSDERQNLAFLGHDFDIIWQRYVKLRYADKYAHFKHAYHSKYLANSALLKIVKTSTAGRTSLIWEIPKGRKHKGEKDYICAIREFSEETRLPKKCYTVMPRTRFVYTFIDEGITYRNVYFPGYLRSNLLELRAGSRFELGDRYNTEVTQMAWLTLPEIRSMMSGSDNPCERNLPGFIAPKFSFFKKITKEALPIDQFVKKLKDEPGDA